VGDENLDLPPGSGNLAMSQRLKQLVFENH